MKNTCQNTSAWLVATFLLCSAQIVSAQWTGSSTIYPTNISAKVGIGTSTPATQLHLRSATVNPFRLESTQDFNWMSYYTAGTLKGYSGIVSGQYDMEFGTSNTNTSGKVHLTIANLPKMTVDAQGRIGIGTVTPASRLHVINNGGTVIRLESTTTSGYMAFHTSAGYKGYAGVFTGPSDMDFGTGAGNTSGKVNLVTGTASGATPRLTVINNGNVGIGIVSPAAQLHVKGSSASMFRLETSNAKNWMAFYASGAYKGYVGIFNGTNDMDFGTGDTNGSGNVNLCIGAAPKLTVFANGNVGIGTASNAYRLSVNGVIRAKEVRVESGWADFVFADNFRLRPLAEVEQFIQQHKHLPDVTPAAEIQAEGLQVAKQMTEMMQKVEELTLYVIQLDKENTALRARVEQLEATQK